MPGAEERDTGRPEGNGSLAREPRLEAETQEVRVVGLHVRVMDDHVETALNQQARQREAGRVACVLGVEPIGRAHDGHRPSHGAEFALGKPEGLGG